MMEPATMVLSQDEIANLIAEEVRRRLSFPSVYAHLHISWLVKPDVVTAFVTIGEDAEKALAAHKLNTRHLST